MSDTCGKWKFFHKSYDSDRWLAVHVTMHPVRCCWPKGHVVTSKWHCSDDGYIWLVSDAERNAHKNANPT